MELKKGRSTVLQARKCLGCENVVGMWLPTIFKNKAVWFPCKLCERMEHFQSATKVEVVAARLLGNVKTYAHWTVGKTGRGWMAIDDLLETQKTVETAIWTYAGDYAGKTPRSVILHFKECRSSVEIRL